MDHWRLLPAKVQKSTTVFHGLFSYRPSKWRRSKLCTETTHLRLEVPLELFFVCLFSLSICINSRTVSQVRFIWALIQSRLESQDPIWSLKRLSTARSNTDIHCNTCVSYENNYEPKLLNIREYRNVSISLVFRHYKKTLRKLGPPKNEFVAFFFASEQYTFWKFQSNFKFNPEGIASCGQNISLDAIL